jgi:hypothetical protein
VATGAYGNLKIRQCTLCDDHWDQSDVSPSYDEQIKENNT